MTISSSENENQSINFSDRLCRINAVTGKEMNKDKKSFDTMLRQWEMLSSIPKHPHSIDVESLMHKLENKGFVVDKRTIQRDLTNYFEPPSPFDGKLKRTESKPYQWYWDNNTLLLDIPAIDSSTAITFSLAEEYLSQLLPVNAFSQLQPYFKSAKSVLKRNPGGLNDWQDKVRIVPQGQTLQLPKVNKNVIDSIYQALLENKQLEASYLPRAETKLNTYTLNPLGLVFRQNAHYLLATSSGSDLVKQFSLHRFKAAKLTEKRREIPKDFSIDNYINEGNFDYGARDKEINLEVAFNADVAFHLQESPISSDQTVSDMKDGRKLIKAKVKDSAQLRWWLFGFADQVEVLKPVSLRKELAERIKLMMTLYK